MNLKIFHLQHSPNYYTYRIKLQLCRFSVKKFFYLSDLALGVQNDAFSFVLFPGYNQNAVDNVKFSNKYFSLNCLPLIPLAVIVYNLILYKSDVEPHFSPQKKKAMRA